MKNGKYKQNPMDSNQKELLSMFSTIGLIVLMVLYLLMTVGGSARLADQTEIISEHSFEVVIAAGETPSAASQK